MSHWTLAFQVFHKLIVPNKYHNVLSLLCQNLRVYQNKGNPASEWYFILVYTIYIDKADIRIANFPHKL